MAYLTRAALWKGVIDDLNNNSPHANFGKAREGRLGALQSAKRGDVLVFCDHLASSVKSGGVANKQKTALSFLAIAGMHKTISDAVGYVDPILNAIESRYAGKIFTDGNGDQTLYPIRSIENNRDTLANESGQTLVTLDLETTIHR